MEEQAVIHMGAVQMDYEISQTVCDAEFVVEQFILEIQKT